MNDSFKMFLWVLGIISAFALVITLMVYGVSSLNTYLEEGKCDELKEKGHETIVVGEGVRNDCKIIYKGVKFNSLESENILMLKLKDAQQKDGE